MRTICGSGWLSCLLPSMPPTMHAPCHAHPLPHMPPPTMHDPCHACPPALLTPLPCEQNDRRLWKHNLSATTAADGNKKGLIGYSLRFITCRIHCTKFTLRCLLFSTVTSRFKLKISNWFLKTIHSGKYDGWFYWVKYNLKIIFDIIYTFQPQLCFRQVNNYSTWNYV